MDPRFRPLFNAAHNDSFHEAYLGRLEAKVGCPIPYRVAETPFFVPSKLRDRLGEHARGVLDEILDPALVQKMKKAIPAELDAPGMGEFPDCVQIDFAITMDEHGELDGRVVELQAFPSLYALMTVKLEVLSELMRERMPGLERDWSMYYGGLDTSTFTERLRGSVVAAEDPREVVLLDIDPKAQKTYPDFVATKLMVGVDSICPSELIRDGRQLYRNVDGQRVPVKRIYNRVVFDELEKAKLDLPFRYTDDLDVTWCSHPNWYWVLSKYSLPFIRHSSLPRARTLREVGTDLPEDLSKYVLKPLFSFAGAGVKVDVTREDIDLVPGDQREGWLLQEKITYHPGLEMPDGNKVKAEVRMMFLRTPGEGKPKLALNLVRLSRGKMLGVDQNKNLTWVGGTVGIFDGPGS